MVILHEQIPIIWRGIRRHMEEKNISASEIAYSVGLSREAVVKGLKGEFVWLASNHLPLFVDYFGLRNGRSKSFEDTADILTDEECIELLIAPLKEEPRQSTLWE
jgi:hypothetical protein